ncbi:182 kDa tankyrase-1-binding protein isoform X4 [Zonotrichia albicollis]|uniref:182 kDa tankyrase-1-binding protein isoform X4 n=1 Tax=Zonotrichia albicollis TaxID=44394 RepID=UPI003D810371
MASQPQPLPPAVPCASPAGTAGAGLAGSPDKGSARPKPPVRPKPRVLPKPAVPAKPPVPPPTPGPRHPRPELPSAEKMNRLAGPQPYSGAGAGGPLRRPSFTVRSPETPNGKGPSSPSVTGTEEEVPPAPPTPSRKGPAPFKVTPVPVAARPERFPGTTVEEILAKMDSREGPGSPDRAWLSPFCTDPSSRFGSKTFVAFRKRPSGEADGDPASETPQMPRPAAGELGMGDDGHPVAEMSSSPPAGPSCAGDPCGRRRPLSPPDLSTLQLGALGPPGSPRPPTCPAPAPGAPFQPAEPSAPAPGSPDAPPELLAPDSPTLPPGSPESPTRPPVEVPVTSIQAPGAPSATDPQLGVSRSPGSPHTPGEGSPGTASPPGTPELPPRVTCPPGSPEAAAVYLGPPSPPLAKASRPPGSPEGPDDSTVSPRFHEGPDFNPPPRDVGLRRSSEGVLRPPPTGQGLGELGGSLSALPRAGDLLSEPSLGSESGWSLSQSFEWTFPSRGARLPAFPPRSPIRETPDSGLSEEGESDGEAAAPSPPKDSRAEGPGSQQAEGAPCPGGPVAQREAEHSAEEEEREAEQDAPMSHSPLHVTEPSQQPAEPESPTQPSLTITAPLDPAPPDPAAPASSAWAGDGPKSLQGPGGPGQAEKPSQEPDPHADPGWLTELLESPGVHSSPENLLGWSRKDLCSEFGIGHPRQDSSFDWSHPGASRERDWPVETKQDQEFGTKSSWDSNHSNKDSTARESWSGDYRAAELMGDTKLGCSDWSRSLGTAKSCPQDPDFSASTAEWGQGYGSTEELGSRQANWGSDLGTGHVRQLDKEPRSGQPTWADSRSAPSPSMGDVPADCLAVEPPRSESPSHSEEERHPSEPATAPQSPTVPPLMPEAVGGIPMNARSEEQPSDHPDGESSLSWREQRLSLTTPQPEESMEQGQEFPLLEDTELLDSSVFRCKASLGRKRPHRAPSLRPTTSEGESWIFRDSTEPRPAPAVSSDEEAAEEPRSRRMRGSSSGRGVKVPLFPGLSASAIKAKLRGRNRSAEEGTSSGDSKGTPPKDPHVQRSKSCKIPGVSGKPPALPPKPEKSSGSEASPPHWLQALKLKRKKP